ncbi:Embryo-specific protein ATS3B, partial [Mucuna pruriens]
MQQPIGCHGVTHGVPLFFFFASVLILSVSESKFDSVQHRAAESFSFGYTQMKTPANCSYLVTISTSCSSPKFAIEKIGIAFGDAYGNEVYEPRLDDPASRTFEQCSLDTFQLNGGCPSPICYVYLYRSGAEHEWKPETVKIYGNNTRPLTFNFNFSLPDGYWYGYNWCDPTPFDHLSFQKWLSPQKWLLF